MVFTKTCMQSTQENDLFKWCIQGWRCLSDLKWNEIRTKRGFFKHAAVTRLWKFPFLSRKLQAEPWVVSQKIWKYSMKASVEAKKIFVETKIALKIVWPPSPSWQDTTLACLKALFNNNRPVHGVTLHFLFTWNS